jgi:DNA-binding CsgD family transcriptional regulator
MSITDLFFKSVQEIKIEPEDHDFANHSLKAFISISKISDASLYVVDYHQRRFAYVPPNPLFLCGYTVQEVYDWGLEYFSKVIPPRDLEMLLEINDKWHEFYYTLPLALRDRCFVSADFNLTHRSGHTVLANYKLTPLAITRHGDTSFALILTGLSTNKSPGNAFIQMLETPAKRYNYSITARKFIEEDTIDLSERERQVLKLMTNERITRNIATSLYISENTVKHHKKNIYEKLGVNCIEDAIFLAIIKNLI